MPLIPELISIIRLANPVLCERDAAKFYFVQACLSADRAKNADDAARRRGFSTRNEIKFASRSRASIWVSKSIGY